MLPVTLPWCWLTWLWRRDSRHSECPTLPATLANATPPTSMPPAAAAAWCSPSSSSSSVPSPPLSPSRSIPAIGSSAMRLDVRAEPAADQPLDETRESRGSESLESAPASGSGDAAAVVDPVLLGRGGRELDTGAGMARAADARGGAADDEGASADVGRGAADDEGGSADAAGGVVSSATAAVPAQIDAEPAAPSPSAVAEGPGAATWLPPVAEEEGAAT
eukprot:350057-Chlamydomonas_euryale.AAC.2